MTPSTAPIRRILPILSCCFHNAVCSVSAGVKLAAVVDVDEDLGTVARTMSARPTLSK